MGRVIILRITKVRPMHEACGLCGDAEFPLRYLGPCKDALKAAELALVNVGIAQPKQGEFRDQ